MAFVRLVDRNVHLQSALQEAAEAAQIARKEEQETDDETEQERRLASLVLEERCMDSLRQHYERAIEKLELEVAALEEQVVVALLADVLHPACEASELAAGAAAWLQAAEHRAANQDPERVGRGRGWS